MFRWVNGQTERLSTRRTKDLLDKSPQLDLAPVLVVRACRGDPRGVGVVRRADDEQAIDDLALRLEAPAHVELTEAGQTVRPAAVLRPALAHFPRRWREVGRSR